MSEVGVDGEYKTVTMQVGTIASKVAGVRNGLDTNSAQLKVTQMERIFRIYDDLSKLISAYGEMVVEDLEEFRQVGVNIEKTDEEASQ